MKSIMLLIFLVLFISCTGREKYKYIESGRGYALNKTEEFESDNDYTASIKGYELYCTSLAVSLEHANKVNKPWDRSNNDFTWKVTNSSNDNIILLNKLSDKVKDSIYNAIVKVRLNNDIIEYHKNITIDTALKDSLLPYFVEKKGGLNNSQQVYYIPKSAPKSINRNGIYAYISINKEGFKLLKFKVQHVENHWFYYDEIEFLIDGQAYEYSPRRKKRDSGDGMFWQWFDDRVVIGSSSRILEALAKAKSAKIKFIGGKYYEKKSISQEQIRDIKRALELYKALGGKFYKLLM